MPDSKPCQVSVSIGELESENRSLISPPSKCSPYEDKHNWLLVATKNEGCLSLTLYPSPVAVLLPALTPLFNK